MTNFLTQGGGLGRSPRKGAVNEGRDRLGTPSHHPGTSLAWFPDVEKGVCERLMRSSRRWAQLFFHSFSLLHTQCTHTHSEKWGLGDRGKGKP